MKQKIKQITSQWLIVILYKRAVNRIRIKNAIKQANRMNQLTKKRFYVLQIFGRIRVYDRYRINLLINRGVLSKKMKQAIYIQKVSIYFTK